MRNGADEEAMDELAVQAKEDAMKKERLYASLDADLRCAVNYYVRKYAFLDEAPLYYQAVQSLNYSLSHYDPAQGHFLHYWRRVCFQSLRRILGKEYARYKEEKEWTIPARQGDWEGEDVAPSIEEKKALREVLDRRKEDFDGISMAATYLWSMDYQLTEIGDLLEIAPWKARDRVRGVINALRKEGKKESGPLGGKGVVK